MTLGHVRTGQFISGTIMIAKFELTLSEPEMKERISDCVGAVHGSR